MLKLHTLGLHHLTQNGVPVAFTTQKVLLLLIHLRLKGDWVSRETLIDLLWPDPDLQDPRASLRRALSALRAQLPSGIEAKHDVVRWNPRLPLWCDLDVLRELQNRVLSGHTNLSEVEWEVLNAGEFLRALPEGTGSLHDWVVGVRTRVQEQKDLIHHTLASRHLQQQDWEKARRHIQARLKLSPLNEEAHLQRFELHQGQGQVQAARTSILDYQEVLRQDIGVGLPESWQKRLEALQSHVQTVERAHLPVATTRFIGRDREIGEALTLLSDPSCRLVTLHGPGGAGKSRLSLEVARQLNGGSLFPHGVVPVRLEHLTSLQEILLGVLAGLNLTPPPGSDLLDVLCLNLADRQLLLVLDNFEHLQQHAPLLSTLLARTGGVKILTTSRVRLQLEEEHVYPVQGLSWQGATSDAVQLLLDRVGRVRKDFHADLPDLIQLCQHLSGYPLALEMAAHALRYLTPGELLQELQQETLTLELDVRNVQDRHRTMEKVIQHSWNLLSGEVQHTLMQLSVFEGGFTLQGARQVTGMLVSHLKVLLDSSLLQVDVQGRFKMHPLIHQFTRQQLSEHPGLQHTVEGRHLEHFLSTLRVQEDQFLSRHTVNGAASWIEVEWENLSKAWGLGIQHERVDVLLSGVWALTQYAELRGRYREVILLFEHFSHSPLDSDLHLQLRYSVMGCRAYLDFRIGDFPSGLEKGQVAVRVLKDLPVEDRWALWMALEACAATSMSHGLVEGHYLQAEAVALQDLEKASTGLLKRKAAFRLTITYGSLVIVCMIVRELEKARMYAARSISVPHSDDSPYLAYAYAAMGSVEATSGNLTAAEHWLSKGLQEAREIQYSTLVHHMLPTYTRVLGHLGQFEQGARVCLDAIHEAQTTGNQFPLIQLLEALGDLYRMEGRMQLALDAYRQCFETGCRLQGVGFASAGVLSASEVLFSLGHLREAVLLLHFLQQHPFVPDNMKGQAVERLGEHQQEQEVDPLWLRGMPWQELLVQAFGSVQLPAGNTGQDAARPEWN